MRKQRNIANSSMVMTLQSHKICKYVDLIYSIRAIVQCKVSRKNVMRGFLSTYTTHTKSQLCELIWNWFY